MDNNRITRSMARRIETDNIRLTRSKARSANIKVDVPNTIPQKRKSRKRTRTTTDKINTQSNVEEIDKSPSPDPLSQRHPSSSTSVSDTEENKPDLQILSESDDEEDNKPLVNTPDLQIMSDSEGSEVETNDLQNLSDSEVSEDDDNDDVTIRKLGSRELLDKKVIIYEFEITGNKKTNFLIDYMASFNALLNKALDEIPPVEPLDRIQMNIVSSGVEHHISTPVVLYKDFNTSYLLAAIQAASQSGQNLRFEDDIRIDIRVLKLNDLPQTTGGKNRKWYKTVNVKLAAVNRRCIVRIQNNDNMCLSRALAVCLAHHQATKDPTKRNIYVQLSKKRPNKDNIFQKKQALEYCHIAGISPDHPCGTQEISKLERALNIYIKIVSAENFFEIVYDGMHGNNTKKPVLYILRYLTDNNTYHYDAIINIRAFYFKSKFCNYCNKGYTTFHRCIDIKEWCYSCQERECNFEAQYTLQNKRCNVCDVIFRNKHCEDVHQKMPCHASYYCFVCKRTIKRKLINMQYETNQEVKERHWCGQRCSVCKRKRLPNHRCYLQKTPYKDKNPQYIFLDFETDQSTGEHIPIYCHIKWSIITNINEIRKQRRIRKKGNLNNNEVDDSSSDSDSDSENNASEIQPKIKWKEQSFGINTNVQNEVGEFIFNDAFNGYTIIAHNMRGFDGCFLLRYLAQNGTKPNLILKDKKILAISVPSLNMRIIDSLNFLPMPLSAFAKSFNLTEHKGHFPHFFSTPQNFTYRGPLPPEEMYGTDTMKPDQLINFRKWYSSEIERNAIFDFAKDIAKYCRQDVNILQEGCWEFRILILSLTNNKCDAFQYITLAGLCNAVYKRQFMPKNSIAAVPPNGYSDVQNFSSVSLEWLTYLESSNPDIKHIGNSALGEATIGTMRVDGYDETNKTAYEFYGCYYHACTKCFPNKFDIHPQFKKTFEHVYSETISRRNRIETSGIKLITMWECEWKKLKDEDTNIQNHIAANLHRLKPLNPFSAFFGGRVETFHLLVREEDKRHIKYADVNSLYPYINASKRYPVGHPTMIFNNFGNPSTVCDRYFGFIYAAVLPPKHLHIPVLPGKYGKDAKLLFVLCRTCATLVPRATVYCTHENHERMLIGTWFSEELKTAVHPDIGYKIQEVYGIYHFEKTSKTLFSEYIKTFYKIKLLASGLPAQCIDETSTLQFITEILQHDDVDLTDETFSNNPGLRSVSKLMLNTLWGKFGTRRILPRASFCSNIEDIRNLFDNTLIEVTNIIEVHKNMMIAISKDKDVQFLDINNNANIYVACATTAYARMELYTYLKQANTNAVYCDTDSIFYITSPSVVLPTGDFLGQLKDELKEGEYITNFVSGGPKNYAYVTNKKHAVIKIKGFSMTSTNLKAFTFDNIANIVLKYADSIDDQDFIPNASNKEKFDFKNEVKARTNAFHTQTVSQASAYHDNDCISVYNPKKIKIATDWKIKVSVEHKIYCCAYDKRMIRKNFTTLPVGYCKK